MSVENETKTPGLFERVEKYLETQFASFEANPVKTGLKLLVLLWIGKKLFKWYKEQ